MAVAAIVSCFERGREQEASNTATVNATAGLSSSSSKKGCNDDVDAYLSLSPSSKENEMLQYLMESSDSQEEEGKEDDGAPVPRERLEKELSDALLTSTAAIPISSELLDIVHNLVNEGEI